MNKRFAAIGAALLLTGAIWGCGGGGGGTPTTTNEQSAASRIAEGQAALNDAIRSGQMPDAARLQAARDAFAQAYSADSTNAQAAFGLALSDIALRGQQAATLLGLDSTQTSALGLNPWQTSLPDAATSGDALKAITSAPLTLARLAQENGVSATQARLLLRAVYDGMDTDLNRIKQAADQTGFTFALADPNNTSGTITVDQADAQALLAGLYGTRAALGVALAYNFDAGTFHFDEPLASRFGSLADGATVAPDQYLPPTPFGSLQSDGRTLFGAAKTDLTQAITTARASTTTFATREAQTGHLLDGTGQNFGTIAVGLDVVKNALSDPFPLGDGTVVNLNAWFTNPPTDVRALLPTYHVTQNNGARVFVANPSDYPDTTFGGLVTRFSGGGPHASVDGSKTVGDLLVGAFNL